MKASFVKIGRKGSLIIPATLRNLLNLHDGDFVIVECNANGILVRPINSLPFENYSSQRQAEFLLSNAVDKEDYEKAKTTVCKMGLNPNAIPHKKP